MRVCKLEHVRLLYFSLGSQTWFERPIVTGFLYFLIVLLSSLLWGLYYNDLVTNMICDSGT